MRFTVKYALGDDDAIGDTQSGQPIVPEPSYRGRGRLPDELRVDARLFEKFARGGSPRHLVRLDLAARRDPSAPSVTDKGDVRAGLVYRPDLNADRRDDRVVSDLEPRRGIVVVVHRVRDVLSERREDLARQPRTLVYGLAVGQHPSRLVAPLVVVAIVRAACDNRREV